MHLKSLTLKGFKSFASATTLRFEPGITAVVGPNGSGKSNVVDAIAWVLGEQGAKALRGGKMEDVIFAGTAGRAPLGRAEVTLTIDNSDGELPIEFTEVSLTRRMFRDGASEYEINGESARLLDIQELLSDSGIGREMHVIVGQGQLDAVLQARPEDRRGFIEEAAGVLKHRKRKERALRKLDAMQANLTRLTDLTDELRRQVKPLGRQAEVARRAAGVQAELRDSRLRLLADDLVELRGHLQAEIDSEALVRERRTLVEAELGEVTTAESELDGRLSANAASVTNVQQVYVRLSGLAERLAGTQKLAADRARLLAEVREEAPRGTDPELLEAEAAEAVEREQSLLAELESATQLLTATVERRQVGERTLADAESAMVAAAQAVADRREGLAKLAGEVHAMRTRASASGDEIARLVAAIEQSRARASEAHIELTAAGGQVDEMEAGQIDLDAVHEAAVTETAQATAHLDKLVEAHQIAERERSTWQARRDALALGLTRQDGTGALLSAASEVPGLLGSVAELLSIEPGYEAALAAALGSIADGVAVSGTAQAEAAIALLKDRDGGRAGILISDRSVTAPWADSAEYADGTGRAAAAHGAPRPTLPYGCRWADDLFTAPESVRAAVSAALVDIAIVPDLAMARRVVEQNRGVRTVTLVGDVFGASWASGGSSAEPGLLQVQAAVDEATVRAEQSVQDCDRLANELLQHRELVAERQTQVERALEALNASDAKMSALAEQLAQLGQAHRSALAETERLSQARVAAESARETDLVGLADLEERLRLVEAEPDAGAQSPVADRDELSAMVAEMRQAEMEARLSVRTQEERARALTGRADHLLAQARAERQARERAEVLRLQRVRGARVARAVSAAAERGLVHAQRASEAARQASESSAAERSQLQSALSGCRDRIRMLSGELAALTDAVHRDEVARAEQRMRIEQLEARAVDEYGVEPTALLGEYGPDQPVPAPAAEIAEYELALQRGETVVRPQPAAYDRAVQEKRATQAERDLALLGKVNPLALEEFAALEERHQFLSTQLEDLKNTRRDLLTVVREVDERILEAFTSAYHDVAAEFEIVFKTLFPGGEGRLVLTEPDDMLATGIEVEARPPGKKVKRLSLLSGGERSLTAVALLVAIFRARPSPFYVMDEVEAALDDVNLTRLIGLIGELRATSQLIIITHQKRTMEVADALYGVAMRGDGITQVISQRLRDSDDEQVDVAS